MAGGSRGQLEDALDGAHTAGDFHRCATDMIEAYGPEVLAVLCAMTRDVTSAEEAFASACEDLWRGLPAFESKASFRTWFFVLARHALSRQERAPARRRQHVSLSDAISDLVGRVRERTATHLRTEVRSAFVELRDELPEDDRLLLILRVDRRLEWLEIAKVIASDSAEDPRKTSARLRKRFQLVEEQLRARAIERGLVASNDR